MSAAHVLPIPARDLLEREVIGVESIPSAGLSLTLKRLLEGDPPPPPSLQTDQLLLAADVNFLGGNGDAGKSTIMFHVAVCTPLQRPVFQTLPVRRPGPVVLVVPEDGEGIARHHVEAIIAGMGLSADERGILERDLHIVGDERPFNLLADTAALARMCAEIRPSLLIADPIGSLIGGGEENDQHVAEAVCGNLRRHIARPFGTACLLAGHLRKPDRAAGSNAVADVFDLKGTVGWSNHARIVWTVSKPKGGNLITLRLVKSNRLPTGIEHQITLSIEANPENAAHWFTCQLTDANCGASSQSLTPGVGRSLNANERAALGCLDDPHVPDLRLSWSQWETRSGLNTNTFPGIRKRLLDAGLAVSVPTGRKTRTGSAEHVYSVTTNGRRALASGWVHVAPKGEGVQGVE